MEQGGHWRRAVEHANHIIAHCSTEDFPLNDAISRAARVLVRTADAPSVDPQAVTAPGTGHSLYMITWHLTHATQHKTWTRARSDARRWAIGDGTEWLALSETPNVTDATRLLGLLCNALPGRARWRPNSQRVDHKCHLCTAQPVGMALPFPARDRERRRRHSMVLCMYPTGKDRTCMGQPSGKHDSFHTQRAGVIH